MTAGDMTMTKFDFDVVAKLADKPRKTFMHLSFVLSFLKLSFVNHRSGDTGITVTRASWYPALYSI